MADKMINKCCHVKSAVCLFLIHPQKAVKDSHSSTSPCEVVPLSTISSLPINHSVTSPSGINAFDTRTSLHPVTGKRFLGLLQILFSLSLCHTPIAIITNDNIESPIKDGQPVTQRQFGLATDVASIRGKSRLFSVGDNESYTADRRVA
jgi:hypothetical protein